MDRSGAPSPAPESSARGESISPGGVLNPLRRRVADRLRRLLGEQGAVDYFLDACELEQREAPPRSSAHLISHLAREIQSMLVDFLFGMPEVRNALPPPKQSSLPKLELDALIEDVLKRSGRTSQAVEQKLRALLGAPEDSQKQQIAAILRALDLNDNAAALKWASVSGWRATAHRRKLAAPRALDFATRERWTTFVQVLDVVLDRAEAVYKTFLSALDDAKKKGPAAGSDIVRKSLAPNATAAVAHFLEDLPSDWLAVLRAEGFFSTPRVPVIDDVKGLRSFPWWPQSAYLARIAAQRPTEVCAAIMEMPETDNLTIRANFVQAALQMPAEYAEQIVIREVSWADRSQGRTYANSQECAALAVEMIKAGKSNTAVKFLKSLLYVRADSAHYSVSGRLQNWEYGEVLKIALPVFVEIAPWDSVVLLSGLLVAGQSNESSWWRAAIEDDEESIMHSLMQGLLSALRDAALAFAVDPSSLRRLVEECESYASPIFHRLALHVLAERGELCPDLVQARAVCPSSYGEPQTTHELGRMLLMQFPNMASEVRNESIAALRSYAFELLPARLMRSNHLPDEKLGDDRRYAFWRWLGPIETVLPADVQREYQELVREFGTAKPLRRAPVTVSWGPRAPKKTDELLAVDDGALLSFIREWAPTPGTRRGSATTESIACAETRRRRRAYAPDLRG